MLEKCVSVRCTHRLPPVAQSGAVGGTWAPPRRFLAGDSFLLRVCTRQRGVEGKGYTSGNQPRETHAGVGVHKPRPPMGRTRVGGAHKRAQRQKVAQGGRVSKGITKGGP